MEFEKNWSMKNLVYKSLYCLQIVKKDDEYIKNTNYCHIYRKKYEISSLPLILEDLRIENVTWFIETSEQVLFFFVIKKDMIVTLLCKTLINLM